MIITYHMQFLSESGLWCDWTNDTLEECRKDMKWHSRTTPTIKFRIVKRTKTEEVIE